MLQQRNTDLLERARELRKNMTPQERKLWYLFLAKHPVRFQRQTVIGNFIADFYCSKALLVIELDEHQHFTEQGLAYDSERTNFLKKLGIEVIRFRNDEIESESCTVCGRIVEVVEGRVFDVENRRKAFQHGNTAGHSEN